MKRILVLGGVLLLSVFGVVACGDDDESQATAEENLCASLEGFSAALANVQGVQLLNPDANQANTSVKRARATWSGVQAAAQDVQEADANALSSAVTAWRARPRTCRPAPPPPRSGRPSSRSSPPSTPPSTRCTTGWSARRGTPEPPGCSRSTVQQSCVPGSGRPGAMRVFGQAGARIRTGDLPLTRRRAGPPGFHSSCGSSGRCPLPAPSPAVVVAVEARGVARVAGGSPGRSCRRAAGSRRSCRRPSCRAPCPAG